MSSGHHSGIVYLVGAGPGDPGLITRRGAEVLARADVVVYDRLADDSLLALAPAGAELVYVGKQASAHAVPQARINELLVTYASRGQCVVRLKGGDPFVFGRGGEEATHLRERGIACVIVPGVSSAVAVPAYAGIPVTDRRHASSFAVITGHEDPTRRESRLDWRGIANGADTLVFLMGLAHLPRICDRLMSEGRAATTPAAVIERGTTPGQRVVTATLADLPARVAAAGLHPPALIVVGEVVRLHERLAWHQPQPLAGRRVLVPRVRCRPSEIVRLLKAAGAETTEVPVLRSETLPAPADLVERLRSAAWLVFISPVAVDALLEQLLSEGRDVRDIGDACLAAVGPATVDGLRRRGLRVGYAADAVADLADGLPVSAGTHVLLVGEEGGDPHADRGLVARGALCSELSVCRLASDRHAVLPPIEQFDAVALASSGTVRRLMEAYPQGPGAGQFVVSIGPATSAAARELGLRVDAEPDEASPAAVVSLLVKCLGAAAGGAAARRSAEREASTPRDRQESR